MTQAALEQQALDQLRRGDLRAAHQTLTVLLRHRPGDVALRRRIQQVETLIRQREETQARIQAEPLRYAHAYIQAGRLAEGLQLLRAALARDPNNERLRTLALQVARKLKEQVPAEGGAKAELPPSPPTDELAARRQAAERARQVAEAEALAQREAALKAQREAEEAARREAALKAQREAEEAARREAALRAQREAEEAARREAAVQAQREAALKAQREAEEAARREAALKAQREAEEAARREAALRAQREAEEAARREAALEGAARGGRGSAA